MIGYQSLLQLYTNCTCRYLLLLLLLISQAGEGATIREIVKYPRDSIEEIVWNDIDADLVQLCDEHLGYVDPTSPLYDQVYNDPTRCKRLYLDAAALLESPPDVPYDIIISDLPDPVTSDGLPDSSLYVPSSCCILLLSYISYKYYVAIIVCLYRYSSKFWKNIYSCAAEKCVVSTHTGPMCQFSVGMATSIGLAGDLVAAGFMKPLVGKVAISSFMGEWGYLICTKDTEIVSSVPRVKNSDGDRVSSSSTHSVQMSPQVWASHLPEGVVVLDEFALQSFFLIPNYYYKR
jgi:predicted membrane-bound spermidine synthase